MTRIVHQDEAVEREVRDQVLDFPREFEQYRDVLCHFVDTLFYPSRHSERPCLLEVHFTSAVQDGQLLTGARQRALTGLGLPAPARQVTREPTSVSYFLKGVFSRMVAHARAAPAERRPVPPCPALPGRGGAGHGAVLHGDRLPRGTLSRSTRAG